MKHRDPQHATRQPTRTELENMIGRLQSSIDRTQEETRTHQAMLRDFRSLCAAQKERIGELEAELTRLREEQRDPRLATAEQRAQFEEYYGEPAPENLSSCPDDHPVGTCEDCA